MNINNPFDKKLELISPQHLSGHQISLADLKGAAIFVTDTLDLCKASAETVFGENATPEIALSIYDRILQRLEFIKTGDEE